MNKTNIITIVVVVLLLGLAAVTTYAVKVLHKDDRNSEAQKSLATTALQSFTDLDGNPLSFSDYTGKIRVVNTWASWSPFSTKELVSLEALATEFANQDVVVIAINRKESKEQAIRFLNSIKTFESLVFAIDLNDTFYASVGGYAMPETIFYDARGNIIFHKRGVMEIDEMRTHVEEALSVSK